MAGMQLQGNAAYLQSLAQNHGDDRGSPNRTQVLVQSIMKIVMAVAVVWWMASAIRPHAMKGEWPDAIWNGRHIEDLSAHCSMLFGVMHWSVLFISMTLIADGLLFLCVLAASVWQDVAIVCLPCLCGASLMECLGQVGRLVLAIWGLVVLFQVSGDVQACSEMYNVAWWCYLGFFLITCCLACCMGCCLGLMKAANQDQRSVTMGGIRMNEEQA